jgi:gamma-D-glutamyl-L-lysine dipeptidyl-peptidase
MKKLLCHLAVVPMRKEPSDRSEMVSQVIYGETMDILEEHEKWYMIQLSHDGYQGWIDKKQAIPYNIDTANKTILITSLWSTFKTLNDHSIALPAGSSVFIDASNPHAAGEFKSAPHQNSNSEAISLIHAASQFIGSPYLWGGRTSAGIDCSGFTQLVFRLAYNMNIPRDAYQQAEIGEVISFVEESQTGDLAFFDNSEGRITHVGIIINESGEKPAIFHASGYVREDKIDHQGIFNQTTGAYTHNLRIIKRIKN